MRSLLGIRKPFKIRSEEIRKKTKITDALSQVLKMKWQLTGHHNGRDHQAKEKPVDLSSDRPTISCRQWGDIGSIRESVEKNGGDCFYTQEGVLS